MDEENEEDEEDVATVVLGCHIPATKRPPPITRGDMQEMFFRLGTQKLVEDQGMDFPWTLASLFDEGTLQSLM